eukprot:8898206-Lingulodinium_polyedra.AAC.1
MASTQGHFRRQGRRVSRRQPELSTPDFWARPARAPPHALRRSLIFMGRCGPPLMRADRRDGQ